MPKNDSDENMPKNDSDEKPKKGEKPADLEQLVIQLTQQVIALANLQLSQQTAASGAAGSAPTASPSTARAATSTLRTCEHCFASGVDCVWPTGNSQQVRCNSCVAKRRICQQVPAQFRPLAAAALNLSGDAKKRATRDVRRMVLAERRAENKAAAVSAGVSAPPPPPPPAVPTVLAPPVVAIPPGPIPKAQAKAGGVAFKRKSTMRLLAKVTPKKGGLRPSTPIGKNRAKRAKKGVATRVVKSPARKTLRRLLRGQKGKAKAFPAERSAEEAADHEDADEDAEEEEDPGWFVNFEHSTTALSFGPGATHSWS